MSFNPDDYKLRTHSVEPKYSPTLPRDANRKETEHETHLSRITVRAQLRAGRSTSSDYQQMFEAEFDVHHDGGTGRVELSKLGGAYDKTTSYDPEKYWYISQYVADVVDAFLEDIGLDYQPPYQTITMWDSPPTPKVSSELEISEPEVSGDD